MPITVFNRQGMPVRLHDIKAECGAAIWLLPGKQHQLPVEAPTPEIKRLVEKGVLRITSSTPARPEPAPAPQAARFSIDEDKTDSEE